MNRMPPRSRAGNSSIESVGTPGEGVIFSEDTLGLSVPHGESRNAARRGEIFLHVQRRNGQHIRDVVESVAGVVRGKISRMIHVEPNKIPHGIAVLGAIEPVNSWERPDWDVRRRLCRVAFPVHELRFARVAVSGAGIPAGGISPARSFRRTFSRVSEGTEATAARESPGSAEFVVVTGDAVAINGDFKRSLRGKAACRKAQCCQDMRASHNTSHIMVACSGLLPVALLLFADPKLFDAVQARDHKAVLDLIRAGSDVNAVRDDGSTALIWAASRDDAEIVAALLKAGANPNQADENGETALLAAAGNGNVAAARMLLDAKAEVNAARWNGDTPLLAAVNAGNLELVRLLADRGAKINVVETRMGQTPLMWAAAEGRTAIARFLIERGADVNATSANGFTPLLFAAQRGDANTARSLIDAKADPKANSKDGNSAFLLALTRGNEDVARLMLDYGVDVNARDRTGGTPLLEAVRQGKIELVKDLVKRGADVNARSEGATPFLAAAATGNAVLMKELIERGADPKAIKPDGSGAVLLAASSHKLDAVQMAVELGLDVNQAPKGRPTPLHAAVKAGANDMVQYLVDHGADLKAKDNFGRTPLEEAEFEAPQSTIELMRKLSTK